ncbi:MAG: ribonuclease protein component [Frankiaceae bacterium]|nr:ribonuclease protein component [Frankiaceae bacterium]MDX6274316.1 ribonuclease protein component [Frankiales bacterium]
MVRNRVKRRLRHLMAARTDQLPVGANLVVRAQSAASTATSAELAGDLDRALARVLS